MKKDYGGVTTTPAKHGRGFFMVRQAWRAAPIRRYPVRRGGWPDDLGEVSNSFSSFFLAAEGA